MNKATTLIFFLFVFILVIYLNKPSGIDQELIRREQEYKTRIDSIRSHYRELLKEDSITFQHYADAKREAERARNEATIWKQRYNHEKANNRAFSDSAIDSLIAEVR